MYHEELKEKDRLIYPCVKCTTMLTQTVQRKRPLSQIRVALIARFPSFSEMPSCQEVEENILCYKKQLPLVCVVVFNILRIVCVCVLGEGGQQHPWRPRQNRAGIKTDLKYIAHCRVYKMSQGPAAETNKTGKRNVLFAGRKKMSSSRPRESTPNKSSRVSCVQYSYSGWSRSDMSRRSGDIAFPAS
jgi:hypothetical protein